MGSLELEQRSLLSSSHTLSKLYDFFIFIFIFGAFSLVLLACDFDFSWGDFQLNTRQQVERDPKKGNSNLGTLEQMCQVSVFYWCLFDCLVEYFIFVMETKKKE